MRSAVEPEAGRRLRLVFYPSVVAAWAFATVGVLGCASAPPPRPLPEWALDAEHGGRPDARRPRPRDGIRGQNESSDLVVAVLQDAGLRFGTDGRIRSLWGYLRDSHRKV